MYRLDNLSKNLPENKECLVHLCCFSIQTNFAPVTYLTYLLEIINDKLYFPHFVSSNYLEDCNKHMNLMGISGLYKGIISDKNNLYIFFELKENITLVAQENNYILAVMYEILFPRTINNKNIDYSVLKIFIENDFLRKLYKNDEALYIPEVGYYKTDSESVFFDSNIGYEYSEKLLKLKKKIKSKTHTIKNVDETALEKLSLALIDFLIKSEISYSNFFDLVDVNKNGFIDFNELINFLNEHGYPFHEDIINNLFNKVDKDSNNLISKKELQDFIDFYSKTFTKKNIGSEHLYNYLINEKHLSPGIYIRTLVYLNNYNIVNFNTDQPINNIKKAYRLIKIKDNYQILSTYKI